MKNIAIAFFLIIVFSVIGYSLYVSDKKDQAIIKNEATSCFNKKCPAPYIPFYDGDHFTCSCEIPLPQ